MNFEFCPDKEGENLNFDPVTSLKLLISPFLIGLFVNVAHFARKLFWALERYICHIPNLLDTLYIYFCVIILVVKHLFFQVFDGKTDNENMLRNFCGSVADSVMSKTNLVYVRFYAEKSGLGSQFESIFTAMRALEGPNDQCDPDPKVKITRYF